MFSEYYDFSTGRVIVDWVNYSETGSLDLSHWCNFAWQMAVNADLP